MSIKSKIKENIAYFIYKIKDFMQEKKIKNPIVKDVNEAIDIIVKNKASISRYGDGEFNLLQGKSINFQEFDENLALRLKEILVSDEKNMLICIPDVFNGLKQYVPYSKRVWTALLACNRKKWCNLLNINKIYYNAFISRPYVIYKEKNNCKDKFINLKRIWDCKELLIVEGEKSRLGIGNDLFNNSKIIERIICPSINAYARYDEILEAVQQHNKNKLVLIALGPTATVLAYDLHKLGYQAIDIGHVDIEYEWFLKKASGKVKIDGKFTNEAIDGDVDSNCVVDHEIYLRQIKKIIK